MRVAFFSAKPFDKLYFDRFNADFGHELVYFDNALDLYSCALINDFLAVCVFVNDHLDRQVLEKLAERGVKYITLRCAGFNNVDLRAAGSLGLRVCRVPAYSPHAVAEHAVALILALNRKTHKAYNRVRDGNFSVENLTGFDLYGKTVGVIGTGQIGQVFCRIMTGFGCKIIAYDLFPNVSIEKINVRYGSLTELLSNSDIISLHCPLTPETHHLFDKQKFNLMKRGAMLINTSRGGLIHTKAAIKALKSGQLGYLGIDVYEQEEHIFFRDLSNSIIHDDEIARLLTFPNVLITSHQGFFTDEALSEIAKTTLQNMTDMEMNKPLSNEITI